MSETSTIQADSSTGDNADAADHGAHPPLIELTDLGIWYRLHRKKLMSLRRALLTGTWREKPAVHWAVRHVNLVCHEGETLGIVGPNGAGKSTLCLVLSGILTPDEGQAAIRGRVSALLSLGAGFNPDLSGRTNIQLYASFLGIERRRIEAQMNEIIEFSELGDFIDEPMRNYSSGMRSRLSFSIAATLRPEIMILDEVLSVGDRAFKAKSQQRIREMMDESRLIVIVSHSSPFLRKVCTHCLWLEQGRARMYGPAEQVLDAYDRAMGGDDADEVIDDTGIDSD